jgi:PIN domain nuclease of toxin-antitoxin system
MLLVDSNLWFKFYWRLPLPKRLLHRIESEPLSLSPISVLEIATKIHKGHLPGIPPIEQWLATAIDGYTVVGVTPEIAAAAGADQWNHRDPADRLIVHTALGNGLTLIHTDPIIRKRSDLKQAYFKLASSSGFPQSGKPFPQRDRKRLPATALDSTSLISEDRDR